MNAETLRDKLAAALHDTFGYAHPNATYVSLDERTEGIDGAALDADALIDALGPDAEAMAAGLAWAAVEKRIVHFDAALMDDETLPLKARFGQVPHQWTVGGWDSEGACWVEASAPTLLAALESLLDKLEAGA